MRLIGDEDDAKWSSRGHFFAAAAEAMRRILVDQGRRKPRIKNGGDFARVELDDVAIAAAEQSEDLVALDRHSSGWRLKTGSRPSW